LYIVKIKESETMNTYQSQIIEATKCSPADAPRIEEIMRMHIFHSPLSWQTAAQFNRGAKKAKRFMDFERSPDGIAMAERVEKEMLA
jgi:hypothetical protein